MLRQPRTRPPATEGALTTAGTQLGRHASIYAAGSGVDLLIGIASAIAMTHFLEPSAYGRLALLFFFSGLVSLSYELIALRGTLSVVFGGAVDEGDGDDAADDDFESDEERGRHERGAKRRVLGTGLVMTMLLAGIGMLVVVALRAPLSGLLQSGENAARVLWAAGLGGLAAVWTLMTQVLRFERRPVAYVALRAVRPVLVISVVIPVVATGRGVTGAIAGTTIASALAVAVALVVMRRSYLFAFSRQYARRIVRLGLVMTPARASFYLIQNGDLFLLSLHAGVSEVGLYRLASRIASLASHLISSLFMSYSPLKQSSAFTAAAKERGDATVKGTFATYFVLSCAAILLMLGLGASTLVRIAPPQYASAAPLIPLLAAGFIAHGFLTLAIRLGSFPHRQLIYIVTVGVAGLAFVGMALVLIPWLGAPGAALSVILAFLGGAAVIWGVGQRRGQRVPYEYGRMVGGFALAGACVAVSHVLGGTVGRWSILVSFGALIAFPVLLVLTGIVPRAHLRPLFRIARTAMPNRVEAPKLQGAVRQLDPADGAALEILLRRRWSPSKVADFLGTPESEVVARAARALCRVGGIEQPDRGTEQRLGAYFFSEDSVADRDLLGRQLWKEGVAPAEIHVLEVTLKDLKRGRRRVWNGRDGYPPITPPPGHNA